MADLKDPRITRYILNELTADEKAEFEQELANDEKLRQAVNDLTGFTSHLEEEFTKEGLPAAHVHREKKFYFSLPRWLIFAAPLAFASMAALFALVPLLEEIGQDGLHHTPEFGASQSQKAAETEIITKPTVSTAKPTKAQAVGRKVVKSNNGVRMGNYPAQPGVSEGKLRLTGSGESYDSSPENTFKLAMDEPLSTFSIDVDTASYTNIRRFLSRGQIPPKDAVRVEEMINYFNYNYPAPIGSQPFAVHTELTTAPWNKERYLLRIGLKGKEIDWKDRKPANLVFLIDVSGSMNSFNKLPLVKQGLKLMVESMSKEDRIAMVVYAGSSGLVLPSTSGAQKEEILAAFDRLSTGGSTNGGDGIQLAYKVAQQNYIKGGINRVLLATDGDFNVGVTSREALVKLVQDKAKSNVFLTVLGFGTGNYKDAELEDLANKGNGNYAYIDSFREGKRVLVEQLGGTLMTIAKDVKIQVDFNPAQVEGYRLIGYENRMLKKEDFNDDKKDAGEIGAGHTVTALYEIVPKGGKLPSGSVTPSKYVVNEKSKAALSGRERKLTGSNEWLTVRLRYKQPEGRKSTKVEYPVQGRPHDFSKATQDTRWATAVAGFGMLLRNSKFADSLDFKQVRELAVAARGNDTKGRRAEMIELIDSARRLGPAN